MKTDKEQVVDFLNIMTSQIKEFINSIDYVQLSEALTSFVSLTTPF